MGGAIGLATIICVDDDASILACLGEQLKRQFGASYDVELASQGPEALELVADLLAEGVTIPLILSDQVMPKMSGDQFLIEAQRFGSPGAQDSAYRRAPGRSRGQRCQSCQSLSLHCQALG
ncbi:MAG: response regulator [Synechococcales cyanobacterium RU_4_20]|nr:response regulator [Synechococcales cyanobacterium RU_4_20]